jgi:predicted O-linked N-acetylglucosamine transferase (SPINDLY family)
MRGRLERAFDKFFDIQKLNEFEAVRLSRELEVDIAIDLGGYTMNSRPKIFCLRAAPIQISYLGYPGTSGNKNIDYFIGDPITITDQNREHFTEKIIQLPNSFLVNPSKRPIAQEEPSRLECGLPENGFVFCCFNSLWKLTPEVFKSWVRILQSIDDSILWLQTSGETQQKNLVQAFESESISKTRIIFANRVPSLSDHLCRYRKASVFLDTFPYGAHTTASDALWAGLPVLTRAGESFASRVAASLLYSVGLPELITNTAREYESAAIELANNPQMVSKMKAKLVENRSTCPLFNAAVVTRQIEAGYQAAYNRYHANLEPDHIYVGSR